MPSSDGLAEAPWLTRPDSGAPHRRSARSNIVYRGPSRLAQSGPSVPTCAPFADPRAVALATPNPKRTPLPTLIHVFVNAVDIEPSRLRELAHKAEVKAEKISKPGSLGVYAATIADDLLGAERLRDLLRRNGVDSFLRQSRTASKDEILAAPLSVVRVVRAESGYGGPRYGTRFDLDDACPQCGTGVGPIVFQTLDHEATTSGSSRRDSTGTRRDTRRSMPSGRNRDGARAATRGPLPV
jgi:hypothetical protein